MKALYFLREYKNWAVMVAAFLLPGIAILFYPAYFHPDDMREFLQWSEAWAADWRNIYLVCAGCTYPFLGTFFSGGVISLIDLEKARHVVRAFHLYLALVDALNVALIYLILKEFDAPNPPFWAGVIGLLPSSWLGTSYWGQIDGIGQAIILIVIYCALAINKKAELSARKYRTHLIVSGVLLACLLLTKQLVLFSILSLLAMTATNVFLRSRGFKGVFFSLLVFLASFVLPIFLVDTILGIPESYASHLQYVFKIGGRIGDVISSYGFNLWVLFYHDTGISSHAPLFDSGNVSGIEISPFTSGIFFFLLANAILLVFMARRFYDLYRSGVRSFDLSDLTLWLFQLSFLNLSFNVFLTGTHERYLYHFYPFAIVCFLANPLIPRRAVYVILAGALLYGAFLFGYLTGLNAVFGDYPFYLMAVFHLFLFVYIIAASGKYFLPGWKQVEKI